MGWEDNMSTTNLLYHNRKSQYGSTLRSRGTWWLLEAILAIILVIIGAATADAQILTLFDFSGAHPFGNDVQSADLAFGPSGQVLEVVSLGGALTQFDAGGSHLLLSSGVQSVDVAFGPSGQVLEVVSVGDALTQFDAAGSHLLFGSGVLSADTAFGPSGQVLAVITIAPAPEPAAIALLGGLREPGAALLS